MWETACGVKRLICIFYEALYIYIFKFRVEGGNGWNIFFLKFKGRGRFPPTMPSQIMHMSVMAVKVLFPDFMWRVCQNILNFGYFISIWW